MEKISLDIISKNFDQYFSRQCSAMGPEEKSQIPTPIISKIEFKKGEVTQRSMDRLGFLGKMFVLFKAMKKRVFIIVEGSDSEDTMNVRDFVNYRTAAKENDLGEDQARQINTHAHFIVGGKDLIGAMSYLNDLSTGSAYNYLTRLKNGKKDSLGDWQMQREFLVRFILSYESNKKKWSREINISIYEFLVLICLYSGKDIPGSEIYNKTLSNSHFAAPSKIREGFSSLRNRKYITKQGVSKGSTFRITALGKHIVDEILDKYALRC